MMSESSSFAVGSHLLLWRKVAQCGDPFSLGILSGTHRLQNPDASRMSPVWKAPAVSGSETAVQLD
jgi:hypothetical protein